MKRKTILLILFIIGFIPIVNTQNKPKADSNPKVEVYYFHPTERCPIDQSIEENTRATMQSDFAKQIKEGTIRFQVLNTDDKANAKTAAKFDINAQALYIVKLDKGKEIKNDLTDFAFSCGQSNPLKFKTRLKEEIDKALK
jgi:hypothetical protein